MNPPTDLTRLRRTLGVPELARLVAVMRRRVELSRPLTGSIRLSEVTAVERKAADDLIGRSSGQGTSMTVSLDELAQILSESGISEDLRTAVEALGGPLTNLVAARETVRQSWATVAAQARAALPHPQLVDWRDQLLTTGLLRRLAKDDPKAAKTLIEELAALVAALPAPATSLAAIAARLHGNAHALDPGSPRATLAVRVAALLGNIALVDDAEGRRSAWASVGIMSDQLSAPVLVYNLPASEDTPLGRRLRQGLDDAEPLHVTLRLLMRHPLNSDPGFAGKTIFVCENPSIVSMAVETLGSRCAPLVCLNGQFATPALVLLRDLRRAGARVLYHGDFDPAGIAIARRAMRESGGVPWRFSVGDYNLAPKGSRFLGKVGPTPWDPALQSLLNGQKRTVHEEAVASDLLQDLAVPAERKNYHIKT